MVFIYFGIISIELVIRGIKIIPKSMASQIHMKITQLKLDLAAKKFKNISDEDALFNLDDNSANSNSAPAVLKRIKDLNNDIRLFYALDELQFDYQFHHAKIKIDALNEITPVEKNTLFWKNQNKAAQEYLYNHINVKIQMLEELFATLDLVTDNTQRNTIFLGAMRFQKEIANHIRVMEKLPMQLDQTRARTGWDYHLIFSEYMPKHNKTYIPTNSNSVKKLFDKSYQS